MDLRGETTFAFNPAARAARSASWDGYERGDKAKSSGFQSCRKSGPFCFEIKSPGELLSPNQNPFNPAARAARSASIRFCGIEGAIPVIFLSILPQERPVLLRGESYGIRKNDSSVLLSILPQERPVLLQRAKDGVGGHPAQASAFNPAARAARSASRAEAETPTVNGPALSILPQERPVLLRAVEPRKPALGIDVIFQSCRKLSLIHI